MSSIFWKNFYICFSKFKCPLQEEDHNHPSPTTSSSTLINTFNSLNHLTSTSTSSTTTTTSSDDFFSSSSDSDTADFAAIFASQRFFFPSPGLSNSIIDSPENSPPPPPPPPQSSSSDTIVAGSVAIRTYSPDPYSDFRQSMQEMIEARQLMDLRADWDYLHELLLCYLTLNPKHTHKFIISAFSDILISLVSSTTTDHSRRKSKKQPRSAALPQLL